MELVDSTAKGEERSERHEEDVAEVAAVPADWREVSDTPRQLRPTVEGLTDEADGV